MLPILHTLFPIMPLMMAACKGTAVLLTCLVCSVQSFIAPRLNQETSLGQPLQVAIGLGPGENTGKLPSRKDVLVAGVDYEIPNHEEHRLDRRSKLDEKCDEWFSKLMDGPPGMMGELSEQARKQLTTLPVLRNDIEKDYDDPEWTPYVSTELPWAILRPAYGLEAFGLPIPRRNAETWRHFDVPNMVEPDIRGSLQSSPYEGDVEELRSKIEATCGWIDDDQCTARLVYWNGNYVPELSKSDVESIKNLNSLDGVDDSIQEFMGRLTDGWTDKLMAPIDVMSGNSLTSFSKLSGPNHNIGEPDTQFAINSQQGTACFAALNTLACRNVGMVHVKDTHDLPVVILNVQTGNGGITDDNATAGTAIHPRLVVVAEPGSVASIVQQSISLDDESEDARPLLVNGYTQIWLKENANITHCFVEESGGNPVGGVEEKNDDLRLKEAARKAGSNTVFETMDVQCAGDNCQYNGTIVGIGGNGRSRLACSIAMLRPGSTCLLKGFTLNGGNCRADIKTNIQHIADGCTSEQLQKNMVSGRSTSSFRGRIRVEQPAQQTDSQQLSRTVLLTDTCRAWAIPSLEIIADDVSCTHGATVSDLSEEELFYLRSRGLDTQTSRNLLMYAFCNDAVENIPEVVLGSGKIEGGVGLRGRIIKRLGNLAPKGKRAVQGEFQSV